MINKKQYDKIKANPELALRQNMSASIRAQMLKEGKSKSGKSFLKHVSYTMKEYREHIEKQFEPWMNWNNIGVYNRLSWDDNDSSTWKWQVDHIVPQSFFKCEFMGSEEFQKCWALSNLRPLSAKQNLLDGNRR